jgi:Zn-dependent peptidase ImmA (M78 family)
MPDGTVVDEAQVPLFPIVRWLVDHWDPLFHEERLPRSSSHERAVDWYLESIARLPRSPGKASALLEDRERWWNRHGLGASLPDYRIPDLQIRRSGTDVELSWNDLEWRTVPTGVVLVEQPGKALLPAPEVAGVLHAFCESVSAVLSDALPDSDTALQDVRTLQGDLQRIREPDRSRVLERFKWAVGFSLDETARRLREMAGIVEGTVEDTVAALLGLKGELESPGLVAPFTVPVLLYRSASPNLSADDLHTLLRLTRGDGASQTPELAQYVRPARASGSPSRLTRDGYELAIELRSELDIALERPLTEDLDLEKVLIPQLGVHIEDVHLDDTLVDGVALFGPNIEPTIAVNRSGRFARTPWGRRMTLAHEMCHLLHDVQEGGLVGVVSNPWADYGAERRANAFAAMLIAPEEALAAVLSTDTESWTRHALDHAMRTLGIGATTLTWQLYNLGWISESERSAWIQELVER